MTQQKPGPQKPVTTPAESFDPQPLLDLIAGIQADLDRLKGLVEQAAPKYDPANPANKMADGKRPEEGWNAATACSTRARAATPSPAR